MGKSGRTSGKGPDVTDTLVYWREVEKMHDVSLSLVIQRSGGQIPGSFAANLYASWPDLTKEASSDGCGVSSSYPNPLAMSWDNLVFMMLFKLDYELGKVRWENLRLPF